VKLVLQCAMCGTGHPVGTIVCSACRATGVAQLRLMFECQTCGRLDLNPTCAFCPRPADGTEPAFEVDELIVAEEIIDEPIAIDLGATDESEDLPLEFASAGEDEDEELRKLVSEFEAGLADLGSALGLEAEFEDEPDEGEEDDN
jgi:hypothetical protein